MDLTVPHLPGDGNERFWDDWKNGQWEPETHAVIKRFLQPGDVFLDIGAWVGPVSLWAWEQGAKVIAVEPDPVAFDHLVHNTKGTDITCVNAALADKGGTARLAVREYAGSSMSHLDPEGEYVVQAVTAKDLLAGMTPSLVKLDVEGYEVVVLPEMLPYLRHIECPIYLSWHQPWWPYLPSDELRQAWFDGYTLEAVRGDGWSGWSELLAVPQ